jgi:hypothetical protein
MSKWPKHIERKILTNTKCVFSVTSKGTPYHYWKKVNNISNKGLYLVQEEDVIETSGTQVSLDKSLTIFYNKKELNDITEVLNIIELEESKTKRDWLLKRLLSGGDHI